MTVGYGGTFTNPSGSQYDRSVLYLPTSDPPLCVGVFLRLLLHGDGEADDGAGRQEVPALPRRHRADPQRDGVLRRLLPLQSHLRIAAKFSI